MALDLVLRPATKMDSRELAAIENESFPDPSWTPDHFFAHDCTVAEIAGAIAGFVVSRQIFGGSVAAPPEREILNIAVSKSIRRAGVATQLLQRELQRGAHLFLEVRQSNFAARNLYRKLGFKEISYRKAYYQNPEESAIVMQMKW